jgi:hypothetical protein
MSRCSDISGVQGTYPFYADAYRKAAADLGVLPRELQSVTWEAVRGLYKATAKGLRPEIENIWRQHQLGRISADDARQQIPKLTNGIKPPEWAERGRGGSPAEALQGAGDEEELPRSCVSGETSETTERRRGGRVAGEVSSAPLSARGKYHYANARGTRAEHCGNPRCVSDQRLPERGGVNEGTPDWQKSVARGVDVSGRGGRVGITSRPLQSCNGLRIVEPLDGASANPVSRGPLGVRYSTRKLTRHRRVLQHPDFI